MKKFITIVSAVLLSASIVGAQESGFSKFLSHIWFPTEFGYSFPIKKGINPGLVTKLALEWRQHDQDGLFVNAYLDTRYLTYNDIVPVGSNLTDGDMVYDDFLFGVGYRFKISDSFCLAASLHGGLSNGEYHTINPSVTYPGKFSHESIFVNLPVSKATAIIEYYIDPKFCIFLTGAYTQHLSRSPLADTFGEDGSIALSLGFNAALF